MIHEAIRLGINTGPEIIAALHEVCFNNLHVGIWFGRQSGPDPAGNHWWRDDDGRYRSHDVT